MVELRHARLAQIDNEARNRIRESRDRALRNKSKRERSSDIAQYRDRIVSTPLVKRYIQQAKFYNMDIPVVGRADQHMAKKFIEVCGSVEKALLIVDYFFAHWEMLRKKWNITGSTITMQLILRFGPRLINDVKTSPVTTAMTLQRADSYNITKGSWRKDNG